MIVSPAADLRAAEPRLITLADRDSFESITDAAISADGERIAYVVDGRIQLWNAEDQTRRTLTTRDESASSLRWSADDKFLYYVSDKEEQNQLWRRPVASDSAAEKLSTFKFGVHSSNLSPNEKLALLTFRDNDLVEKPEQDASKPYVVTRRQFRVDEGQGYVVAGDEPHLYIYDTESDILLPLTSGTFEESYPAWSADGTQVVFVSNRDADRDINYSNDIWVVDTDGDMPGTPVRLTDNDRTKHSPAWSPDGNSIAYISARDGVYGLQHIALVPADGGEATLLTTELDRWIHSFKFSSDSRWIYFNYDEDGSTRLARVPVAGGEIENLVGGNVVVTQFDVSAEGELALLMRHENSGNNVYRLSGDVEQQLTDVNRRLLDQLHMAGKQSVHYDSTGDTRIQAFITTPHNYVPDHRYPAIMIIHGGPVDQFAWGYDFRAQYLAARGYVVIEPNPRGSTGQDQEFIHAIYATWGVTEYPDVIGAVDYAVEHGFADPDNLFVTGYSYGGYMTNVLITETDRFAAAASGAGHSLIEANLGHDIYQQWYMWELGLPWENREGYELMSPLLRAENVTTPTIFLGGSHDWNVPILNSELFYQALRMKGVDSQLVVYPNLNHGGWPNESEIDYLRRIVDWFEKYKTEPET